MLGRLLGVSRVKADHRTQRVQLTLDRARTPLWEVLAKLEFLGYQAELKE